MDDYLLTFELSEKGDELHVCTDIPGLEELIRQLSALLDWTKNNDTEHIHLMTEEWGGYELSSKAQIGTILNHVKVYCWNDEQMAERAKLRMEASEPPA